MLEKSEISFLLLWVVNPIVILFYQNCSSLPQGMAFSKDRAPTAYHQQVSNDRPESPGHQTLSCSPHGKTCLQVE